MYVERENLLENVSYPKGSGIAVLGQNKEQFDDLEKTFALCDKTDEGTRFALVGECEPCLNAYKLSCAKLPFCLMGSRPESAHLNNVLWTGTKPFVAPTLKPNFLVITKRDRREDLEFCARLIFAVAEKMTMEFIREGESKTTFPLWLSSVDFLDERKEEALALALSVSDRVDGLKQAESALTLLKLKEKNEFNRKDAVVLLAKYLAKVYNYFIKYQPRSIFPPDNNAREEALTEFFGVSVPCVRGIKSEYEIRKTYYMISLNASVLASLWENVSRILDEILGKHRTFAKDNGFCLEQICEDAKFAVFMSPDLLLGDTLLSFIKDCGVAEKFI